MSGPEIAIGAYVVVVCALWILTVVSAHKLFIAFITKFPVEAERNIPYAYSSFRHPEKLLFFLRKSSVQMLKRDDCVWKLRQRLILLLVLSVTVPCFGFLAFVIFALLVA
jgi:hypothetical protein